MTFNLQSLVPRHIARMKPYTSARDDFGGSRENRVFLDANELPDPLVGMPPNINRYPGNEPAMLKEKLAAVKNTDPAQIFLGNGSDEIIDLVMRCFARPGKDQVMIFPPTFGMYAVRAEANNLEVQAVGLDEGFFVSHEKTMQAITPKTRLMFICHPNNPTANTQPAEVITRILESFNGIVVADEAYIDFSPEKSLLPLLARHPNLMVVQTFSKAFGLAGARIGVAYASEEIIATMDKMRCPYNLGTPSIELAVKALDNHASYRLSALRITRMRDKMAQEIADMPLVEKVYPSDANFLLVKTSDANSLYHYLANKGVIVRNRNHEPGCAGCLRITVGTASENRRLLDAWKKYGSSGGEQDKTCDAAGEEQLKERRVMKRRSTSETDISLELNLDGTGDVHIESGIGFFDHMLHQIAKHGMIDLDIIVKGDLETDPHHSIEDTAITLGMAVLEALGNKKGIERYGFALPMDESSAHVLLDLGGRSYLKWDVVFDSSHIGDIPASLFGHFFRSFTEAAKCNLHVTATGEDDHHKVEAIFKAFARTLRMAASRNRSGIMPSTKGVL